MRRTLLAILLLLSVCSCNKAGEERLLFAGGIADGSFDRLVVQLSEIVNRASVPGLTLKSKTSKGSLENLQLVSQGQVDMALVYAEDAYAMWMKSQRQGKARPGFNLLARLFGSTAQLIVAHDSLITSPYDLVAKRVALVGTGSDHWAKSYLGQLGLWERITPVYSNLNQALSELQSHQIQAVWLQSDYPDPAVSALANRFHLRHVNLLEAALESGFLKDNPYFSVSIIPAQVYPRQERDILSFQADAFWVVNDGLATEQVYNLLTVAFSPAALAALAETHPAASRFDVKNSMTQLRLPYHPGAAQFLMERW